MLKKITGRLGKQEIRSQWGNKPRWISKLIWPGEWEDLTLFDGNVNYHPTEDWIQRQVLRASPFYLNFFAAIEHAHKPPCVCMHAWQHWDMLLMRRNVYQCRVQGCKHFILKANGSQGAVAKPVEIYASMNILPQIWLLGPNSLQWLAKVLTSRCCRSAP